MLVLVLGSFLFTKPPSREPGPLRALGRRIAAVPGGLRLARRVSLW